MRNLRISALLLLWMGLVLSACPQKETGGKDGGHSQSDGGAGSDGGTQDGGTGQLTDFARDLILNHTADNTPAATTEDKTFAADTEDPNAFPASFFTPQ